MYVNMPLQLVNVFEASFVNNFKERANCFCNWTYQILYTTNCNLPQSEEKIYLRQRHAHGVLLPILILLTMASLEHLASRRLKFLGGQPNDCLHASSFLLSFSKLLHPSIFLASTFKSGNLEYIFIFQVYIHVNLQFCKTHTRGLQIWDPHASIADYP